MFKSLQTPQGRTTCMILGAIFIVCLAFNWNGLHSSIDKSELPALVFPGPTDYEDLKRAMVELRNEVYHQYDTISENVVISAYKHGDAVPVDRLVPVKINGQEKLLHSELINELRGTFLLHPYDEVNAIRSLYQMRPREFDFNPRLFVYGAIFVYALGFTLLVAGKLGIYVLSPNIGFYLSHPEEMSKLYASGEWMVGTVGALGVFLIYAVGKAWKNRNVGLIAAFLYALVPVFMLHSHRLKPHAFSLPFVLAAFLFCLKFMQSPFSHRTTFVMGLMSGLAIGVIYTHWFFLLPLVLIAIAWKCWEEKAPLNAFATGMFGIGLGFVLFNPYYVLAPHEPWQELNLLLNRHVDSIGTVNKLVHFVRFEIVYGLGWPWIIAAVLAAVFAVIKRERNMLLLVVATILSPLGSVLSRGDAYYASAFFCFLLLWIAYGVDALMSGRRAAGILVLGLLGSYGLAHQMYYASFFRQNCPQYDMSRWIRDTIPDGATIVRVQDPTLSFGLPFQFWRYELPKPTLIANVSGPTGAQALSQVSLKDGNKFPDYVFVVGYSGLPNEFSNEGRVYRQVGNFYRRGQIFSGTFSPNLAPFFTFHYYAYALLPSS